MKKLFTLFFAVVASIGTIFAYNGTCGENLTWDLTDGVLTISGTGDMANYLSTSYVPWWEYISINKRMKDLITSVVINSGVTSIGSFAFTQCPNLISVTIPDGVTRIGSNAFTYCTGLKSVNIPSSVTYIGEGAFALCTGLPVENNLRYADTYLVRAVDETLSSYTIKEGTRWIGFQAFLYCAKMTSIEIPNSVTSIETWAFQDCSTLTSVTIGSGITSISYDAFDGCNSLNSLTISSNAAEFDFRIANKNLEQIAAPAWFFDVEESEWASCPKYLQAAAVNAGELNDNVLAVIGRSYKTLKSFDLSGVTNTELEDEAVKGFYNLESLKLPAGLTKIGYMAVADCKSLQSIDIPASVKEIDNSAFENCRSIKSITFGDKQTAAMPGRNNARVASNSELQRIGNWAFYNCHELQNLEIPEGVTEIGDGAFYGCTYLEQLSLPASVRAIGDNTFALCSKMNRIVVNAANPPAIQAKTFFDVKRQIPVYVPDESVNAYKNDNYWKEFDIQGVSHMPQSIENTYIDAKSTKILRDGQLFILRGDKVYNVTGMQVK